MDWSHCIPLILISVFVLLLPTDVILSSFLTKFRFHKYTMCRFLFSIWTMLSKQLFLGWVDYCMLIAFLSQSSENRSSLDRFPRFSAGVSAAIGIWHGCFGNKQSSTKDFLMAGGKMNVSHSSGALHTVDDASLDDSNSIQLICYPVFSIDVTGHSSRNLQLWVKWCALTIIETFLRPISLDSTTYLYFGLYCERCLWLITSFDL